MIFPTYLLKLPECLKGKIEWDLQVIESMRSLCRQIVWRREWEKKRNKAADRVGNDWMLPDSEKLILFKLFLWLHWRFCVTQFSFALLRMCEFIFRMLGVSWAKKYLYYGPSACVINISQIGRKTSGDKTCKFIISSLGNSSVYSIRPIRFFHSPLR